MKSILMFGIGIFYGICLAVLFNYWTHWYWIFLSGFGISLVPIGLLLWRFMKYPVKEDDD